MGTVVIDSHYNAKKLYLVLEQKNLANKVITSLIYYLYKYLNLPNYQIRTVKIFK